MTHEILIIDDNYIWVGSLEESTTVIELMKVPFQKYFLIGNDPVKVQEYYEKIDEEVVRGIEQASQFSSFVKYGDIDLLFVNLN
jgi:hypothetical protein